MSDPIKDGNALSEGVEIATLLLTQTKLNGDQVTMAVESDKANEEQESNIEKERSKTIDEVTKPINEQAQAVSTVPSEEGANSSSEGSVESEHQNEIHVKPDEITAFDFNHIRNLGLTHTDQLGQMLTEVPIEQFSELTSLNLRFYSAAHVEDKEAFKARLVSFLKTLKHLSSFTITCDNYQTICPIDTICEIGASLTQLHMLGADGYGGDQISVADLEKLLIHCPSLESLVVDLPMFPFKKVTGYNERKPDSFQAKDFLAVLPKFTKLKSLKLRAEYSLDTQDPLLSISTDPDYDDALRILKELYNAKQGVSFEYLSVILEKSFQPQNWRPAGVAEEEGHPVFENYWCPRRQFCYGKDEDGEYKQWVTVGSGRVGDLPDESAEARAQAEADYEEYLETNEYPVKNSRPLFCCGMKVWLVDGMLRARDDM